MNILQQLSEVCDEKDILKYSEEAFYLAEKLNDRKGMAVALNNIGYAKTNHGKIEDALVAYLRSLAIWEELDDKNGIATSLNELGYIYDATNQKDKALESYQKSLEIRKKVGDKKDVGYSLNNIGVVYQTGGNLDKALEYFLQSLKAWEETGYKQGISIALNNIGYIYYNQHNLIDALKYYQQSLQLEKETMNMYGAANSLNNIGAVYFKLGDIRKATQYAEEALQISRENKYIELIIREAKSLTDIYIHTAEKSLTPNHKDWEKAFEYQQLYSQMKDTFLTEESSKQITEMQTKYETEKKEQQITLLNKDKEIQNADLKRQKIIIWSVGSGLLLVVVLSLFIFRERKKSEKLLLNILPVETAKELKRKGKATPRYYESVTVMFTDFKNFTQIAEKLSADELVGELDFIFKKFDEIISKYQIEKIKTIGDAYMCVSGLPTSNSNHAEEIVKAALEIQRLSLTLSSREGTGSPLLKGGGGGGLRIGIHTGPVTAGVVGDKKFAYDIWGDTVNTASRMESSGEAGKVNISEATHLLLTSSKGGGTVPASLSLSPLERVGKEVERWKFIYRGEVEAKHKGKIKMYFLESRNNAG